ncbi:hemin ABC transporter substrate-binding protein [Neisseria leonii]|uniref:heme/hemin ABC transporter substrate-binding protein n=1 Tax=Neisseria leonii TaxID=2995413 RepID=UPI00237C4971|nr:ABC transporter substrate-binding protein [Neisseria sp. 3986]MDD9326269.1 ABC transporter substrate-binding protein [Neisseria sp. 3986]
MKKYLSLLLLAACLPAAAQRVIVLTPDVADIVARLGAEKEVVGIHEFNRNPAFNNTPSVGFYRNLSAEPILAGKPDLVIGSWLAKPDGIYTHLRNAGVKAENVHTDESPENYRQSLMRIGRLLGKEPQAANLARTFQNGMQPMPKTGKRYLLSYDGRYAAGRNTVGDTLIRLAGGINAAAQVDGLKPLSREGWLKAKPDIVIIAKHNEQSIGGAAKVLQRPEIAASPAGQNRRVLFWPADDYMRYGLYTPDIVRRLHGLAQ